VSYIILTAADAEYFDLVRGTICSIRSHPEGKRAVMGFFDLGCTPEQLHWLGRQVDHIRHPDWEINFPIRDQVPQFLKGIWGKPFLPRYFSGYDTYVWVDADAWVQDWRAVELLLKGADLRGMAIMPEVDRGSQIQYGGLFRYWNQAFAWYETAYGENVAQALWSHPMLNTGVFAIKADAPHWDQWIKCLEKAAQHLTNPADATVITEQLALNLAVYGKGLFEQTEMLPGWCNWTCHWGLPLWDKARNCLVEPYLPHTPIGILHLTVNKHDQVELLTIDREPIQMSLRYPS